MPHQPIAIIDIGSNSVRLVVYSSAARVPVMIFNEKVMAGLGKGLAETGLLSREAQDRALTALARFHLLTRQMNVKTIRVVATAAVRDAANGAEFVQKVRDIGLPAEMLSGEAEGAMAGWGVLSAFPGADGVVADLGGGSLELVDVSERQVRKSVSLPLGVFRITSFAKGGGERQVAEHLSKLVDQMGFGGLARGRPLYLVGGSWRALARFDIMLAKYPLPIVHGYRIDVARPAALQKTIDDLGKARLKEISDIPSSRLATLSEAAMLLKLVAREVAAKELVVSSFGIREGLLFHDLDGGGRLLDPLTEAAREAGRGLSRFGAHGDILDKWIAPIFGDEEGYARLRLAACLLADIAWQAHPEFRADRGLEMALHGNWVGIDAPGRVMIAQALYSNFGGGRLTNNGIAGLCPPHDLQRASRWGLAMRLGQRLCGGVGKSLERTRLAIEDGVLRLKLRTEDRPLYGESVDRRLKALAVELDLPCEFSPL